MRETNGDWEGDADGVELKVLTPEIVSVAVLTPLLAPLMLAFADAVAGLVAAGEIEPIVVREVFRDTVGVVAAVWVAVFVAFASNEVVGMGSSVMLGVALRVALEDRVEINVPTEEVDREGLEDTDDVGVEESVLPSLPPPPLFEGERVATGDTLEVGVNEGVREALPVFPPRLPLLGALPEEEGVGDREGVEKSVACGLLEAPVDKEGASDRVPDSLPPTWVAEAVTTGTVTVATQDGEISTSFAVGEGEGMAEGEGAEGVEVEVGEMEGEGVVVEDAVAAAPMMLGDTLWVREATPLWE